jgi:signal peptidase II
MLADSGGFSLVADTVRFELTSNSGAFLSMGAGLPSGVRDLIFLGLVPCLLLAVCGFAIRSGLSSGWPLLGLALIAGGGLANWLDRLFHDGAVTDYVSLGIGPLRTGIFNLADVSVMAGAALLLFAGRPPVPKGGEAHPSVDRGRLG